MFHLLDVPSGRTGLTAGSPDQITLPLLESQTTTVMSNCYHNQFDSFTNRYLKKTPILVPRNLNYGLILRIVKHLVSQVKQFYKPEFSFNKYVQSKPGGSRRRFLRAYSQLLKGTNELPKISKITAFVKNERYFDESKSPRMIMGRDPRFNILYARFIARIEDAFFQLEQVANACDFHKCGQKFKNLIGKSKSMFENDMSKYEASQREFALAIEFLVYAETVGESEIDDLATLFAVKMVKSGHTGEGLKFYFLHCRGSGDMDTGLGNGVLNYITTMYFKIINFCPLNTDCHMDQKCCQFDAFVLKGDDSYGTVPEGVDFNMVKNTYEWFGFEAKLIHRPDGRLTEFCSGNFIRVAGGDYYYVQNLRKLVTSLTTCLNPDVIREGWVAHYYRSLGDMYAVLYKNIPFYEDIAGFLQTASSKLRINVNLVQESYGHAMAFSHFNRNVETIDARSETILDISDCSGLTFPELDALRTYFTSSKICLPPQYNRRCNIRATKRAWVDLDEDIVYNINKSSLTKEMKGFRKTLLRCLREPLETLGQLAQSGTVS